MAQTNDYEAGGERTLDANMPPDGDKFLGFGESPCVVESSNDSESPDGVCSLDDDWAPPGEQWTDPGYAWTQLDDQLAEPEDLWADDAVRSMESELLEEPAGQGLFLSDSDSVYAGLERLWTDENDTLMESDDKWITAYYNLGHHEADNAQDVDPNVVHLLSPPEFSDITMPEPPESLTQASSGPKPMPVFAPIPEAAPIPTPVPPIPTQASTGPASVLIPEPASIHAPTPQMPTPAPIPAPVAKMPAANAQPVKPGKLKKEEQKEINDALRLVTQLGLSMFICLFIGVMAGRTLDGIFKTSPVLLMVFTFLGAVTSFKVLYDLAIKRWMK